MAEIFASKLAQSCISETMKRLEDLQIHETGSLSIGKEEVRRLKEELTRIFLLLPDAEKKQEEDYRVRTWIAKVIDAAHDIEDVVEIFISNLNFSNFITKLSPRHKFMIQFDYITSKLADIFETQKIFQIQSSNVERYPDGRISFPDLNAKEYDLVGLEGSTKTLKARLINEEDDLSIVSICGMGGAGKTSLARKVYEQSDVKKHFDCCAWTCVSQQYQARDILSDILLQVGWGKTIEETEDARKTLGKLRVRDMISHLRQVLKEKRYLVVLDDIWEIDAWNSVREAFPKDNRGSKIVFTTRIRRVAESSDLPSFTIVLPLLSDEESFELLRKKSFPNYSCSPELEQLGREIIKKCRGLPLAIVVLGGLLNMKKSDDARKALTDLVSELNKRVVEYELLPILALSYNHLPYQLKPLFLYMSNFPEDSEIPKRKLIRLWLAEGFLTMPASGNEANAEQYLEELIRRNVVEVAKRDHSGGVKTCRLHDLMRDFCISKAREENFCGVMKLQHHMNPMAAASSSTSTRRIGVYFGSHHDHSEAWVSQFHPHLRSLLCFHIPDVSLIPLSKEQFGLLRVLELSFVRGATKCKLSKKIGDLIHLRYLGLRAAQISELPATIGNLRNLLTLDIRDNDGIIVPEALSKLGRLTHLLLPLTMKASPFRMDKLTNIQTLKFVEAAALIRKDAKSTLVRVRNLGIQFKNSEEARVILESRIVKSGCLQSLTMSMPLNHSFSSLQPLTDCTTLCKLDVTGKIQSDLQSLPPSLTKLVLEGSDMKEDPMKVLEKLPNLKFLRLGSSSYMGAEMTCSVGGFPVLEILELKGLSEVEVWKIDQSAMPSLKRLDIEDIPKLRMLPEGIQIVKTLLKLNVSMCQSFVDQLQGEDS
ncbi:hypothetical protein UlMin_037573 [Ulmus minor]